MSSMKKSEYAGIPLENSQELQRTVRWLDLRRGRFGRSFRFGGQAEFTDQFIGQLAPEQKRKKSAESQQDAIQMDFCS